jgi:hypothetical protein
MYEKENLFPLLKVANSGKRFAQKNRVKRIGIWLVKTGSESPEAVKINSSRHAKRACF